MFIPLFCSCSRGPVLMREHEGCWVRVQIDWSTARIEPNGASVYFFPKAGGKPHILLTNDTLDSLYLPVGEYSVLLFNERTIEHANIGFRGTDAYETFEAYLLSETSLPDFMRQQTAMAGGVSVETPGSTKISGEAMAAPDVLAVARQDLFEVTGSMKRENARPLLEFIPRRVMAEVQLEVRVSGAQYLAQGGSGGTISGMAGSVMLATGQPTAVPVSQYFTFQRVELDADSKTDGSVQATFSSFGPVGLLAEDGGNTTRAANVNILWMQFFLRDGSIYTPDGEFDVTEHFERDNNNPWTVILKLLVGFGKWGDNDIPVTLPKVESKEEGAVSADLNDWGEDEVIDSEI